MSGGLAPFVPSHYLDVSGQLHVQPLYPHYPLSRQTDPATQVSCPCLHITLQGRLYHFADLVVTG